MREATHQTIEILTVEFAGPVDPPTPDPDPEPDPD